MDALRIKLAALWVMLMLTYLLGDVIRIFSGDFQAGTIQGKTVGQAMYLGIAAFMAIPIVMIYVSLTVDAGLNRWLNTIVAVVFFVFNLFGLPSYPSAYDKFLIVVGLIFNLMTVGQVWLWG